MSEIITVLFQDQMFQCYSGCHLILMRIMVYVTFAFTNTGLLSFSTKRLKHEPTLDHQQIKDSYV